MQGLRLLHTYPVVVFRMLGIARTATSSVYVLISVYKECKWNYSYIQSTCVGLASWALLIHAHFLIAAFHCSYIVCF